MLILDTDHMSELARDTANTRQLETRLAADVRQPVTTNITAEELLRGRMAQLARARTESALMPAYARFHETLASLSKWRVMPFDATAIEIYGPLRTSLRGIGTMDLRIASIALANNATLLSRNLRDFQRIPNLTVEDWLQ